MKFVLIFAILAIVVVSAQAQARCRGSPRGNPVCRGPRDEGNRRGAECGRNAMNPMWYYNPSTNSCIEMRYLGCGGNNNRYCSKADCVRQCRRRS